MKIHRTTNPGEALFEPAYKLYEESFPRHEQRPRDKQQALLADPAYHFDLLLLEGVLAGLLAHWDFGIYSYIEHFAISPEHRGRALGSRALNDFIAASRLVILEIAPPVDQISISRERFYRKLGFQSNPYPHLHPAYRENFAPHPLVVLSHPVRLSEKEYARFKTDLDERVMQDAPGS